MALQRGEQFVLADRAALQLEVDEPGLMVDSGADVVEVGAMLGAERVGDLRRAMLHAVAEADRADAAVSSAAQVLIAIGLA